MKKDERAKLLPRLVDLAVQHQSSKVHYFQSLKKERQQKPLCKRCCIGEVVTATKNPVQKDEKRLLFLNTSPGKRRERESYPAAGLVARGAPAKASRFFFYREE